MLYRILLFAALIGFLSLAENAAAAENLQIQIEVSGVASGNFYSAVPLPLFWPNDPNASDLQLHTGIISSADQQWKITADGTHSAWSSQVQPEFATFASLLNALKQNWTITLDQGLSTERRYTMNLNLGTLPSINVTPPVITSPLPKSAIDSLTSTFTFTPPALNVPVSASLDHLPFHATEGSFISDDRISLPTGSTRWSPSAPLIDDTQYYFNLAVGPSPVAGLAFTDPVDGNGNGLAGWSSNGYFTLESSSFFSTVATPEPGFGALIGICTILLLARRRKCSDKTLAMIHHSK